MEKGGAKKVILFLAIILAVLAIVTSFMSSEEIPLEQKEGQPQTDTENGKVGVTIVPPTVEDKTNTNPTQ